MECQEAINADTEDLFDWVQKTVCGNESAVSVGQRKQSFGDQARNWIIVWNDPETFLGKRKYERGRRVRQTGPICVQTGEKLKAI